MTGFVDLEELLEHIMAEVGETPLVVKAEDEDLEFRWNHGIFEIVCHPWSPDDDVPDFLVLSAKYRMMDDAEKAEWKSIEGASSVDFDGDVISGVEIVEATNILSLPMDASFWGEVHAKCHGLMRAKNPETAQSCAQ